MPSIMRMLGKANWWMPRWLDRILPHVDIDGGDTHDADAAESDDKREPALASN